MLFILHGVCVRACAQACGHRWKNVYYSKKDSQNHKLPNGVCYRYDENLRQGQQMIPCYRGEHTHTLSQAEAGKSPAGSNQVAYAMMTALVLHFLGQEEYNPAILSEEEGSIWCTVPAGQSYLDFR